MKTKRTFQILAIAIVLAAFAGCQSSGNQANSSGNQSSNPQSAQQGSASASAARGSSMPRRSEARQSAAASQSSQPARPRTVMQTLTLPAGTPIHMRLNRELNTGTTNQGSVFEGTLAQPITLNGVLVAQRGSLVTGRVTNVVSSGRLNRPAELSLMLTSITPTGGQRTSIATQTWSIAGKSHKKRDLAMIGGGAGVGAIIGAIAGGGKGAAIGGLIGGAGGTAGAYVTGKKEISLPAETELNFRLSTPASFTVKMTQ